MVCAVWTLCVCVFACVFLMKANTDDGQEKDEYKDSGMKTETGQDF